MHRCVCVCVCVCVEGGSISYRGSISYMHTCLCVCVGMCVCVQGGGGGGYSMHACVFSFEGGGGGEDSIHCIRVIIPT